MLFLIFRNKNLPKHEKTNKVTERPKMHGATVLYSQNSFLIPYEVRGQRPQTPSQNGEILRGRKQEPPRGIKNVALQI